MSVGIGAIASHRPRPFLFLPDFALGPEAEPLLLLGFGFREPVLDAAVFGLVDDADSFFRPAGLAFLAVDRGWLWYAAEERWWLERLPLCVRALPDCRLGRGVPVPGSES